MIRNFLRPLALAAAVFGTLAGTALPAAAGGSVGFSVTIGDRGAVHLTRGPHRDFCRPRQALRKASRLGLRHARIVRENRRVVVVKGRSRDGIGRARFAQARGCPVVSFRR